MLLYDSQLLLQMPSTFVGTQASGHVAAQTADTTSAASSAQYLLSGTVYTA